MKIRPLSAGDYDALYSLWTSCPGMGLNSVDDSPEGIARFIARNPETCLAAVDDDGRLVGAILAGHDGRRGHISHTAVSPDVQGQGIGRSLVEAVLEAFSALGISKVTLVVFERNRNGNAFWEKMGFGVREDLVYRDRALADMTRYDT